MGTLGQAETRPTRCLPPRRPVSTRTYRDCAMLSTRCSVGSPTVFLKRSSAPTEIFGGRVVALNEKHACTRASTLRKQQQLAATR